jgi:DNA-binding transcriptional regulator YiaG
MKSFLTLLNKQVSNYKKKKRTLQEWEQDRLAPRGFARTAIEKMIRL